MNTVQELLQPGHIERLFEVDSQDLRDYRVIPAFHGCFKELTGPVILQPEGDPFSAVSPQYLERVFGYFTEGRAKYPAVVRGLNGKLLDCVAGHQTQHFLCMNDRQLPGCVFLKGQQEKVVRGRCGPVLVPVVLCRRADGCAPSAVDTLSKGAVQNQIRFA